MAQYIKRLKVVGLFGRFDIDIRFSAGVNIVHGVNGAGKTTMLHILTNATRLDVARFGALAFNSIEVEIGDGPLIAVNRMGRSKAGEDAQIQLLINDEDISDWPEYSDDLYLEDEFFYGRSERIEALKAKAGVFIDSTYFPAFRTMHEAWSSIDLADLMRNDVARRPGHTAGADWRVHQRVRRRPGRWHRQSLAQTMLTREIFGEFVPAADYPSVRDIQRDLNEAIQSAINRLAAGDRALLSSAFSDVFAAISGESMAAESDKRIPDELQASISKRLDRLQELQNEYGLIDSDTVFESLRGRLDTHGIHGQADDETTTRILRVYDHILARRERNIDRAFSTVRTYIDAVNNFFAEKQMVAAINQPSGTTPRLWIRHNDETLSSLDTLSSGERQIAGLIYAATHLAQGNVVLVDEPELSLHVDWQHTVIQAMMEQMPGKQFIVCTHSSAIGSEFLNAMVRLIPTTTAAPLRDNHMLDPTDDEWMTVYGEEGA